MSGFIRNAVNALFSTATTYLPGTLGQRLKDFSDKIDSTKGADLVGYNNRTAKEQFDQVTRIENIHAVRQFYKSLYAFESVENSSVAIACYGDSVSADIAGALFVYIGRMIGQSHQTSFGSSFAQLGGVIVYAGGAGNVQNPATGPYDYLPTAQYHNVPAGGSVTFASASQASGFVKVTFYYAKIVAGGTATVDLLDGAGLVVSTQTVSTASATLNAGKLEFSGLSTGIKYGLRVTASGGTVIALGVSMFKPRGISFLAWQLGGSTLDQQNTSPKAIFDFINLDHGVSLFVSECKGEEASTTGVAGLASRLSAYSASVLLIGSRPDASPVEQQVNNSLAFRTVAVANGYAFIDAYHMLKDYATLVSLGWGGDGTHLDNKSAYYVASVILRSIPLGVLAKFYATSDVFNDKTVSNELAIKSAVDDAIASRITIAQAVGGGSPTFVNLLNVSRLHFGPIATAGAVGGYGQGTGTFYNNGQWGDHFARSFQQAAGSTSISGLYQLRMANVIETAVLTVATLPATARAGAVAYVSNGRKVGEGAGAGTGVMVYHTTGAKWCVFSTDAVVAV